MEQNTDNKALIENVLKKNNQDIELEPIPEENESPLAQPVVDKTHTSADVSASKNETTQHVSAKQEPSQETNQQAGQQTSQQAQQSQQINSEQKGSATDAPEQEIDAELTEEEKEAAAGKENEEFSMPLEHARLMADSIIGTINNTVFEVGGGYFVTIRKHKDFYDFEELIQVIDEQNVKNVKRLKLDEEDKALLRPLLVQILRKKSAALSPEKQLLMVALSIIIKKAKAVMEIRAENEILVERIRDIIRHEIKAAGRTHEKEEEENETTKENNSQETRQKGTENGDSKKPEHEETLYEEVTFTEQKGSHTGIPDEALEKFN
ncbi:MAG: hypothetical protein JST26_05635 [Bacteroidetes bacterium]|nr:hypothetical protein [Bacteroidota bacterium]